MHRRAARTGLALGAKFQGSHGPGDAGEAHEAHSYVVAGILARSGTVRDLLVVRSVDGVWAMHGGHLNLQDISDIANQMKEEKRIHRLADSICDNDCCCDFAALHQQ